MSVSQVLVEVAESYGHDYYTARYGNVTLTLHPMGYFRLRRLLTTERLFKQTVPASIATFIHEIPLDFKSDIPKNEWWLLQDSSGCVVEAGFIWTEDYLK